MSHEPHAAHLWRCQLRANIELLSYGELTVRTRKRERIAAYRGFRLARAEWERLFHQECWESGAQG